MKSNRNPGNGPKEYHDRPRQQGAAARPKQVAHARDQFAAADDAARVVIVVGASTRAFAESAARAGWRVHAADLFGDLDLEAASVAVRRLRGDGPTGYPAGLPAAVAAFPPGPCAYTGAVENHPEVIAAIARTRPLAGCGPAAIAVVRDHARLAALVGGAGLKSPATVATPDGVPLDGSFLVKPVRTAGGRGIARWYGQLLSAAGPFVWQEHVAGENWSAAFVADRHGCRLVAATRQLVGCDWCGAKPFAYCGSIDVPLAALAADVREAFERLGTALATIDGLVGLIGVDAVVDAAGRVHVIEVNPRPTASMELAERATGRSIAALHLAACGLASPPKPGLPATAGIWAKAVVFTAESVSPSPGAIAALAAAWNAADGLAAIADIPAAGEVVPSGGPLVTVFARGADAAAALGVLRERVAAVRAAFSPRAAVPGERPPPGNTP